MSCLFAWLVLKSQINPSAVSLLATYVFKYDSVFSPQTADNETWIYCAYLRGRRTYSYAINTDVLKQRLHLICGTKHTQEQRYTTDPWSGQRDNMSLLMCLHFSLRVKLNFSVFLFVFQENFLSLAPTINTQSLTAAAPLWLDSRWILL